VLNHLWRFTAGDTNGAGFTNMARVNMLVLGVVVRVVVVVGGERLQDVL
jgi:hypothetical protein